MTASSKLWKKMIQTVLTSQQHKSGFSLHVKQYVWVSIWHRFMETVENKLRNQGTNKLVSPNANTQQQHIPDMVPTPITKHSTRASKVKAGPSTAIPWAMLSLTSSWKHMSDISVSQLLLGCGNKNQNIIVHTWELELKANLARAHALERSMRSRKKGKASLKDRIKLFITSFWKSCWKKGLFIECVLTWGQWAPYQESEWQLCWTRSWRRWWKGQQCLQEKQMESGQKEENITDVSYKYMSTDNVPKIYLEPSCLRFWNWK